MNTTSQTQMPDDSPWSTEDWKREFAEILFSHKYVIFLTGMLVLIGALLVVHFWPPIYVAQGEVLVQATTPSVQTRLIDSEPSTMPVGEAYVRSEMEILTSKELIKQTLQNMHEEGRSTVPGGKSMDLNRRVRHVKSNLEARVVPYSHVIRVSYYAHAPAEAESFLEELDAARR